MISQIIIKVINQVIDAIEEVGLDYAIFGGLALQVWKRIRSTLDIDVMVAVKNDDISSLMDVFLKRGLKLDKDKAEVKLEELTLFRFIYPDEESLLDIKVDIAVAKAGFTQKVVHNSVKLNVFGREVHFVKCEDLILLKLLSDRPIDIVDAQELLRINKEVLNKKYLQNQAEELKIDKQLSEIEKNS